ncbi:diacylglycerol kinase family protein [Cohnella lupini]|uniref:Undecaprenol kinase/diacylglycerol kinase (ATP) n=1 Tax=Cohnella lupini TaxID=1294267 RepID=A0A3D9IV84_9BACL|nr:diacylglycerol kinase family protein [Cohnella lupini]RED65723.1 undecaprenol kinase/diacylglycerol kinase (ATP) [Cohnella lupini]
MSGRRSRELDSFRYAISGIAGALKSERHMKFHMLAAVAVVVLSALLGISRSEWLWILAAIALVLVSELFNTAVERAVDLASPEIHPLAKTSKDVAAGAALVAALFALFVGALVLGPHIWTAIIDR